MKLGLFKTNHSMTNHSMTKLIKSVTSPSLPKNTMRNMFTGNASGILNNFNLKKFGGQKDLDFDGLFNSKDCQPKNSMRQDKVLFPKYLEHKGVFFDKDVKPRDKKLIVKQIRKNPELLKNTSSRTPTYIDTTKKRDDVEGFAGLTHYENYTNTFNTRMIFPYETIHQKYDPDFIEFLNKTHSYTPGILKDEGFVSKKASDYPKAKHHLARTMGHEFEHLRQFRDSDVLFWKDFVIDDYQKNEIKYEKQADDVGKELVRKEKYSDVEREIDESQAMDFFNKQITTATYKARTERGFEDDDGDGVSNITDCEPDDNTKQDFTPFKWTDSSKMSAAKRFGGKNLKRLPRIGGGRDRDVFALDKDKVIKIAKNPGGLTQNTYEKSLDYPIGQIKHYETGLDYAVMERADPPGKATRDMLQHLKKARDEAGYNKRKDVIRDDFFNSPHFEASGLDASDFSSHSVNPSEFTRKSQWGEKDGQPVLVDAGVLTSGRELDRYRIKHFQQVANIDKSRSSPWQLEEWQDTQKQRQQFRNKGSDRFDYPQVVETYEAMADFFDSDDQLQSREPAMEDDSNKRTNPYEDFNDYYEKYNEHEIQKIKPKM